MGGGGLRGGLKTKSTISKSLLSALREGHLFAHNMGLDFLKVGWRYRALEMFLVGRSFGLSGPVALGVTSSPQFTLSSEDGSVLSLTGLSDGDKPPLTRPACSSPCESLAEALPPSLGGIWSAPLPSSWPHHGWSVMGPLLPRPPCQSPWSSRPLLYICIMA